MCEWDGIKLRAWPAVNNELLRDLKRSGGGRGAWGPRIIY